MPPTFMVVTETALCLLRIVLPGSEEGPPQSKGLYKDGMAAAHSSHRCHSLGYREVGESPALSRTKQRCLGRGEDQGAKWQHCNYRRFASWSRIPDRSRKYGGQGPARSRKRWEVLSRKSGHRQKGRPTFHRECGIQDKTKTTTYS